VFGIAGWEAERRDQPDRAIIGDPTDRSVSLTSVQTCKPERIDRAVAAEFVILKNAYSTTTTSF